MNSSLTFIINKDKDSNRYYIKNGLKSLEYVANYNLENGRIRLDVINAKDNTTLLILYNDWIKSEDTKIYIRNDELLNNENNLFNEIVLNKIMKVTNNLFNELIMYIDQKNKAVYVYNDSLLVGYLNDNFIEIKEEGLNINQISLVILSIYFMYFNTNWIN